MENPKTSAVERLKEANNVLVTVSTNPSVDQLAGAIGMTLLLNKLGKHATAVFSGDIPSTIEFLQPEQTLERNTDSLRDFIISLDKAKADKLRYKVEEKLVRIFITPYHTSLSHDDLEFSLGDFNVDVIVALGVHEQQELDQAIAAHGRILHDATIVAINTRPNGNLGTISWVDEKASSLSEMLADLGLALKSDVLDEQMATALLTGIVAETNRFSNEKTSSATMSLSAKLMAAGANQQLVATKLQESADNMLPQTQPDNIPPMTDEPDDEDNGDGSLRIDHHPADNGGDNAAPAPLSPASDNQEAAKPQADEHRAIVPDTPRLMMEPPSMGGTLTAAGQVDDGNNANPLSLPAINTPLLTHDSDKKNDNTAARKLLYPEIVKPEAPLPAAPPPPPPPPAPPPPPVDSKTLEEIETAVDSPHRQQKVPRPTDADLQAALGSFTSDDDKLVATDAQPVDLDLGHNQSPSATVTPTALPTPDANNNEQYINVAGLDAETGLPTNLVPPSAELPAGADATSTTGLLPPPLVPPPMMPAPPPLIFGEQPLPNREDDNQMQQPLGPL